MAIIALVFVAFFSQERKAVPDDAALKEAEKAVREIFKEDFAKKSASDRQALAKKLLAQGRDAANAPASQYAILTLAIDLSTQVSDVDSCVSAMNELGKGFDIDLVKQKATSLSALAKVAKTPDEFKAIARAYLQLAEEAVRLDRFDDATKAVESASAQSKRAKDVPGVSSSESKVKEVAARKSKFEKVKKSKEVLAAMPDDPGANLAVGQYYCLVKGDWASGLPMLVKSSDGPLKSLAVKDAANPEPPADQIAVGDGWWDLAEKTPGEDKSAVRARAGYWYEQALSKLAGLDKKKVEQRLSQITIERLSRGNWIDLNDPAMFGHLGKFGEPIEKTIAKTGDAVVLNSKPFPPGEYDALQVRVRLGDRGSCNVAYGGPGYRTKDFIGLKSNEGVLNLPGPTWPTPPIHTEPLPVLDEYLVIVVLTKDEDIFYLNGQEMRRWPTQGPVDKIEFWAIFGTVKLDKIRLRKR